MEIRFYTFTSEFAACILHLIINQPMIDRGWLKINKKVEGAGKYIQVIFF